MLAQQPSPAIRTARILVVDDDPLQSRVLVDTLADEGFAAHRADTGARALDLLRAEDYDVVLLDLVLPDMDGYEVCARLKADPQLGRIPVIMLTATTSTRAKVRGLGSGADDYVVKPFDPEELLARIGVMLRLREAERATAVLYAIQKEEAEISAGILDFVRATSRLAGIEQLCERLIEAINRTVSPERCSAWRWDEDRMSFVQLGGDAPDMPVDALEWPRDAVLADRPGRVPEGAHAFAFSILGQSRLLGRVVVEFPPGRPPTRRDFLTIEGIVDHAAVVFENLQLRVNDVSAFQELAGFSGETLHFDRLAERLLAKLATALDARALAIWLMNDGEPGLALRASSGEAAGEVLRPAWVRQRLAAALADGPSEPSPLARLRKGGGAAVVPLRAEGETLGALAVQLADAAPLGEWHRVLLGSLAAQAALVIRTNQLYEAAHELAINEERSRIAREVHDGVAQTLAHTRLKLQLVGRLFDEDGERAKAELSRATAQLAEAIRELRNCIYALRPSNLAGVGLTQALQNLVRDFAEQTGATADFEAPPTVELSGRLEMTVFRFVQEALNNVRKHANAGAVRVRLAVAPPWATVVAADDGAGFDPTAVPEPSAQGGRLGLLQLRERLALHGGGLVIDSAPGRGTTLTATFRLDT